MLTNSKIALSVALVLATASAAVAQDGPSDWSGCWGLLSSERCNRRSEHIGHCVHQSLQRANAVPPSWQKSHPIVGGSRRSTDDYGRHIMSRREYRQLKDACEHADAPHPPALLRPRRERP
jgi:hypothetical protein